MQHYVYEIVNKINHKIYVGKRSCECNIEKDVYMGSGDLIKIAQEKYGINNFTKKVLQKFQTAQEAYDYEASIVTEQFLKREDTYNIALGGGTPAVPWDSIRISPEDYREKIEKAIIDEFGRLVYNMDNFPCHTKYAARAMLDVEIMDLNDHLEDEENEKMINHYGLDNLKKSTNINRTEISRIEALLATYRQDEKYNIEIVKDFFNTLDMKQSNERLFTIIQSRLECDLSVASIKKIRYKTVYKDGVVKKTPSLRFVKVRKPLLRYTKEIYYAIFQATKENLGYEVTDEYDRVSFPNWTDRAYEEIVQEAEKIHAYVISGFSKKDQNDDVYREVVSRLKEHNIVLSDYYQEQTMRTVKPAKVTDKIRICS